MQYADLLRYIALFCFLSRGKTHVEVIVPLPTTQIKYKPLNNTYC